MYRYQQEHIPAALVEAKDADELVQADSLMDKIAQLEQEARRLGKKAEDASDLRGAMGAVRELVRIVELLAKIQGELKEPGGTTVSVVYVNAQGIRSGQLDRSVADLPSTVVDVVPESS